MISMQAGSSDLNELCLKVNRIMDHFIQGTFFRFRPCDRWQPSINLYETDAMFSICVDLAGVDPKQVELHTEKNVIHVMGQRTTPIPAGGASPRIHVMEIDHGPFYRAVSVPENVDMAKIDARYCQGLLWIDLPKREV